MKASLPTYISYPCKLLVLRRCRTWWLPVCSIHSFLSALSFVPSCLSRPFLVPSPDCSAFRVLPCGLPLTTVAFSVSHAPRFTSRRSARSTLWSILHRSVPSCPSASPSSVMLFIIHVSHRPLLSIRSEVHPILLSHHQCTSLAIGAASAALSVLSCLSPWWAFLRSRMAIEKASRQALTRPPATPCTTRLSALLTTLVVRYKYVTSPPHLPCPTIPSPSSSQRGHFLQQEASRPCC